MIVLKIVKSHPDVVDYFKELQFYDKHIEKPKIKCLKNTHLLSKLPFCKELNLAKINHSFKGYTMSSKVETTEKKDSIKQSEANKLSIKDLKN